MASAHLFTDGILKEHGVSRDTADNGSRVTAFRVEVSYILP